jgi:hypothetical protein
VIVLLKFVMLVGVLAREKTMHAHMKTLQGLLQKPACRKARTYRLNQRLENAYFSETKVPFQKLNPNQ